MAQQITMPRLSDTMTEGTVAKWLKKVGDKISEGDILAEIETDKATMEFESFNAGTLLHIGIQEGETASVDSLLAIIGEQGEDISSMLNKTSEASNESSANAKQEKAEGESVSEVKKEETKESGEKVKEPAGNDNKQSSGELPKGVTIVTMPRLSDTMTEGTVAKWLKKVGDKISEGDILAEIETDKATMEFESFNSGTLLKIGIEEGQTAPIDSVLAIIGPEGTDVSSIDQNTKSSVKPAESQENQAAPAKDQSSSEDTVAQETDGKRIFISPLARKIADEKGIEISKIKGSGENGRIVKSDVENYSEAKPSAERTSQTQPSQQTSEQTSAPVKPFVAAGETHTEEIKNSQMRKTIAKRLSESKFTAPHYYLTIEVAMDNAMASRDTINTIPDTKVSFNDMVLKACAMALRKHPKVNSQWKDDATLIHHHVHLGVAVAVEDGLVVPVLKFADQLTLTQIGGNVKDLAGRAKHKKLQPAEMEGSTFTVSNLGMFGISEFTSIINQPNSAILSVGAIEEKPVVKNGQIVIGNTMKVTLACDHRTVDGATGAQFLQTLRIYLENPVTMLA